jgi:prepilin-type N-terminal cleavage/methylation domain-containing protein
VFWRMLGLRGRTRDENAGRGERRRAFTLIELVTVVVLLGILSSVAMPVYLDYRTDAKRAAEASVIGSVKTAIHNASLQTALTGTVSWPTALDSAAANSTASPSNPFFSNILSTPITSDWRKGSTTNRYIGPLGTTYYYVPASGSFSTTPSGPPPPVSPVMMAPEVKPSLETSAVVGVG